jgi:hypothetical protein
VPEEAILSAFVADDLLVNFDDGWAMAALAALLELSRKTQVLLFTHHRHLVEIGRGTLGDRLSVLTAPHDERRRVCFRPTLPTPEIWSEETNREIAPVAGPRPDPTCRA